MRNCEPYTEVSKETLNPHYYFTVGYCTILMTKKYKKVIYSIRF